MNKTIAVGQRSNTFLFIKVSGNLILAFSPRLQTEPNFFYYIINSLPRHRSVIYHLVAVPSIC